MTGDRKLLFVSFGKYFPESKFYYIKQKIDKLDEDEVSNMYLVNYKDPVISLILSLVAGTLGIDRFYIGDTTMGVLKLITCGGCGVWTIVDYFLIMDATKEKNFKTLMALL